MNPDEVETRALLWSITCGIVLVLAVMVAITCLLLRHNARHQQSGRAGGGGVKGTSRRDATRQRPKTIDEGYIEPRAVNLTSGRPQPIGNPKMADHHPQEQFARRFSPPEDFPSAKVGRRVNIYGLEHSKSSSLEGHIYDEPEHKTSDSPSENKYYNASETSSGSGEYERVSYYANS
ncbi:uncharacterized protein [Procambarus clarkii]|uniref:uncharacterized protein isoform X1 n=1 Tax=Procambarus clarkii TaxID=6728 RepID=UPI001E673110|nr:uncharacterized protein LOC123746356 isoform X1 [Procambarus clarkii]XP_045583781.1 uncharacterized protein LOC123746356 isoform X1 [Procambarus clarkii]